MSFNFRAFVVVLVLAIGITFFYPTVNYYFLMDESDRSLVENTKNQNSTEPAFDTNEALTPSQFEEREAERKEKEEKLYKVKSDALQLGLDIRGGLNVVMEANFERIAKESGKELSEITDEQKAELIDRAIQKLLKRFNEKNLSEIYVSKEGEDRIVVEIPGETSSAGIRDMITTTGYLKFQLVDEELSSQIDFDPSSQQVLNPEIIPPNRQLVFSKKKNEFGQLINETPYVLHREAAMEGDRVQTASPQTGEFGAPVVSFSLDGRGTKQFSEVTSRNIGNQLAIVLDDEVITAPNIQSHIPTGSGQISGRYTHDEANNLAVILRSGSLPVHVDIIQEEIVGPSLGRERLTRALSALLFGLALVVVFMIIRYRLIGLVASLTLLINGWLIISVLAGFTYTITLPGIAGLILTMGMAIDANVLIFERIKEEMRSGTNFFQAIDSGYAKAFWSIFDANTTTLIAAFVLSMFGSGPIQAFAATLFIGIIISMFTALFLSRFIIDSLVRMKLIRKESWLVL